MPEFVHGGFQFGFGHLAVSHAHPGLRSELAHVFHHALQALNPVVNPENLPFALDFALNDLAQNRVVAAQHRRGYRLAVLRRGFDDGQLADAGHWKAARCAEWAWP